MQIVAYLSHLELVHYQQGDHQRVLGLAGRLRRLRNQNMDRRL